MPDAQEALVVCYKDKAKGTKMERPQFNKMLKDIREGKVSQIVVWRLDRLGRTAKGLLQFIEDDLQPRSVNFLSLRDAIDLGTASGPLLLVVLAGVAQFETEVQSERRRAGIAAAREAGKVWGGRKAGTRIAATLEKEQAVKEMA